MFPAFFLIGTGMFAGCVNGLIGTGGGILLVFALRLLSPDTDSRDVYAEALLCMLPLSLLSSLIYRGNGAFASLSFSRALPFLLGAIPGGLFGGFLLDRTKPKTAQLLFTLLILFGGFRMAFGR